MDNRPILLTHDEVATLVNCCFVAAERFLEHCSDLKASGSGPAITSLAQQFSRQAEEGTPDGYGPPSGGERLSSRRTCDDL